MGHQITVKSLLQSGVFVSESLAGSPIPSPVRGVYPELKTATIVCGHVHVFACVCVHVCVVSIASTAVLEEKQERPASDNYLTSLIIT